MCGWVWGGVGGCGRTSRRSANGRSHAGCGCSGRQYRLRLLEHVPAAELFSGEMDTIGAYKYQQPPYTAKNPFLAAIAAHRELHQGGDRSCMHIEFDIRDSGITYEAGDHVGIYPTNCEATVRELAAILHVDLDTPFALEAIDPVSSKPHPFPCPTTYGAALRHYVDIQATPKPYLLRELAEHAADPKERAFLLQLASPNEQVHRAPQVHGARCIRRLTSARARAPEPVPRVDSGGSAYPVARSTGLAVGETAG